VAATAGGPVAAPRRTLVPLLVAALCGAAVAVTLGVYGRRHDATGRALFTLGFSSTLSMKAWLATIVVALACVQIGLALWMYGKVGRGAPAWVGPIHRLVGTLAFLVSLPVAYHCLWALGFKTSTSGTRVFVHSVLGCTFYGAFTMKVLCVRSDRMPGWALPVVGGLVFVVLVALWCTSSLWFFDTVGFPSF
jgi:uncharacterized protein DUF6529